jgi:hypothetical protein
MLLVSRLVDLVVALPTKLVVASYTCLSYYNSLLVSLLGLLVLSI